MEFPTDKQKALHEARDAYEAARRNLDEKIASYSATNEDFLAVQEATATVLAAERMQVCFECGEGCEKPKEWTILYQQLEGENAHLKQQNEEYRRIIEGERLRQAQEVALLQQDLNEHLERANDLAADREVAEQELSDARKRIADLESRLGDSQS